MRPLVIHVEWVSGQVATEVQAGVLPGSAPVMVTPSVFPPALSELIYLTCTEGIIRKIEIDDRCHPVNQICHMIPSLTIDVIVAQIQLGQ